MPASRPERTTVVDALVDTLSAEILRGRYGPGQKLPTLRALARQHDVTLPTVQRAVATLQEMKLIAVRQGSGMRVLDPATHAGLSLLPRWLGALLEDPARARAVLEDFLELRREMALALLLRLRAGRTGRKLDAARAALAELSARAEAAPGDLAAIAEADLAVGRALLAIRPQVAFATVFNAFEDLLGMVPALTRAIYAHPASNVAGYAHLLQLLESDLDPGALRSRIDALMTAVDETSAERFQEILEEETR
jgi:DNA-binding FadR family transcriptional regulator